jgi:hypothetical protein
MYESSLAAHLAVNDPDHAEIAYDHTSPYGLRHLRLGAHGGQVVIDLPLDAAGAARFLRRLAATAAQAAHVLEPAD